MGFTGAHMLYVLDVFILALYLISHVCALLEYTFQLLRISYSQCFAASKEGHFYVSALELPQRERDGAFQSLICLVCDFATVCDRFVTTDRNANPPSIQSNTGQKCPILYLH